MKISTIHKTLLKFAEQLGDEDFTVSLAICETKFYISVSCHSSKKYKFDHGGLQRTAEIPEDATEESLKHVLNDLVDKYKECLEPRENNSEDIHDAIKRAKTVSEETS